jgi:nicotinate-nucleotide adenylyltransferase
MDFEEIIRSRLSEERFYHSICVRDQAVKLARRMGADEKKAAIAGILHDICKEMPDDEQLQCLLSHGILSDSEIAENTYIRHGFAAAEWVRRELDIQDEDILNAIRYHTTARAGMSALEKVIFLADLTSADRDFPDLPRLREALEESVDKALEYCVGFKIEKGIADGMSIPRITFEAYREIAGHDYRM